MTKKTSKVDTSPKTKNITLAKIKRQATDANKMETYDLNSDDRVRFYPIFPENKIKELIDELTDIILQAKELGETFSDEKVINHTFFLCIKHFTHLKKDISDKYEEQLQQLDYLIDSGLYRTIMNDIFMPSELNKVLESLADVFSTEQFVKLVETKMFNRLEELKVRNKDMMNVLSDKEVERIQSKYNKDLKH